MALKQKVQRYTIRQTTHTHTPSLFIHTAPNLFNHILYMYVCMYTVYIKIATNWWIRCLELRMTDKICLQLGEDLNDIIINAAQRLLHDQYSRIHGFQNTILGVNLLMKPQQMGSLSVQILHTGICMHTLEYLQLRSQTFLKKEKIICINIYISQTNKCSRKKLIMA